MHWKPVYQADHKVLKTYLSHYIIGCLNLCNNVCTNRRTYKIDKNEQKYL